MMEYKHFGDFYDNKYYHEETKTICKNIKYLKGTTNLSYRKLSVELGFNPRSLNNYVTQYVRPNKERLERIVKYFEINDIDDLIMNEKDFKSKYPFDKKES